MPDRHRSLDFQRFVEASDGTIGRASSPVKQLDGDAPALRAEAARIRELARNGRVDRGAAGDNLRSAVQQPNFVAADSRLLDQGWTVDQDDRTIQKHELERDRAVIGDERVRGAQVRRRVGIGGEIHRVHAGELAQRGSPVEPARTARGAVWYERS